MNIEWNVLNKNQKSGIKVFNVFNSFKFSSLVAGLCNEKEISYKDFSERLKNITRYCFWSKYEYEIVVSSFPSTINIDKYNRLKKSYQDHIETYKNEPKYLYVSPDESEKIDVYYQLTLNWNCFAQYVWNNKDLIKKEGEGNG